MSNDPIAGRSVLITGANRGIGQALVEEALRRGASRVYAGMRKPLDHPDERVTTLSLDVTDEAQIQSAAESVDALDMLINDLQGGRVLTHPGPAGDPVAAGRPRVRRTGRAGGYRDVEGHPHREGVAGVRCAGNLRRPGRWGRGDLP
jgi:NAD(P)-dependent dehydrogenase (short-subunit alcohol dehydrogenase family)